MPRPAKKKEPKQIIESDERKKGLTEERRAFFERLDAQRKQLEAEQRNTLISRGAMDGEL
jgi:hypothetical protein